jgi:hypothetical protein
LFALSTGDAATPRVEIDAVSPEQLLRIEQRPGELTNAAPRLPFAVVLGMQTASQQSKEE